MAADNTEYPNFDLLFEFDELDYEPEIMLEFVDPSIFDEDPFLEEALGGAKENTAVVDVLPPQATKRFKSLSETELQDLSEQRFSSSTKRNSKWGFKVFSEWCLEKGVEVDLTTVPKEELADQLSKFYAEAQPKSGSGEYHRSSLKNLRAALNRFIQVECGRSDINIAKDQIFKKCNDMLCAKLKNDCRQGLSRPTTHKPVIPQEDMKAIFKYLNSPSPITLRYKVWILLSIHYVSRGLEFHGQLSPRSFAFNKDESGCEFATITHSTQQKNHQGDLNSVEENGDKRMYASDDDNCPVRTLKTYLDKLDPKATSLFCHINLEAIANPVGHKYWYLAKSVGNRQFRNFMPDICKNAGIERRYTAHSLRATSLSAMSDNNIPVRHIMTLSDHTNEMSLIPYARPSTEHKKTMSNVLTHVYSSNQNSVEVQRSPQKPTSTRTNASSTSQLDILNTMMNGFITNSKCDFNNCTFSFGAQ